MSTKSPDPFAPFIGPGTEAFKLWISFFPTAPFFGVEWRFKDAVPFAPMMPGLGTAGGTAAGDAPRGRQARPHAPNGKAEPAAGAKARPAPEAAAPAAEPAAKPAPKSEPAPKAETPAEPKAETPAEPKAETPAEPKPAPKAEAASALSPVAEAPAEAPAVEGTRPSGLLSQTPANPDDLKMIRGIGPGLESKLNALGIYKFDQIAGFSESDLVWVDENLTAFKGRCFRDDWVGQARALRD